MKTERTVKVKVKDIFKALDYLRWRADNWLRPNVRQDDQTVLAQDLAKLREILDECEIEIPVSANISRIVENANATNERDKRYIKDNKKLIMADDYRVFEKKLR